jgi:predicted MFS family arabinose efflux permease
MLGGLTAEIDEKAPFYAVAILAGVNFVVAWVRLPESRPTRLRSPGWPELRQSLVPTPVRLVMLVHDRRMALFLYLFFHLFSAFAVLEALITLYASKQFGMGALDVGLLFMWIGAVLFITQGLLLRRIVDRIGESSLVAMGLVAMGAGLAGLAFVPSFAWFYPVGSLIAFGNGITFPSFTSLYSKACQAENAGELLGQSQAMGTTGRIVGPMLGGWIMDEFSLQAPFVIAGAMMIAALVLFQVFRRVLVAQDAS